MLLRRVIDHVKTQNWTAVALDFFIVVIGVFIGIQVSNWNAARADGIRAAELQVRLAADFESLVEGLAVSEERVRHFAAAAAQARATLSDGAMLDDPAAFGELLETAGSTHPPLGASATYLEMLSTGDLGLIRNPGLRAALVDYHAQAEQSERIFQILLPRVLEATETIDMHVERRREEDASAPVIRSIDYEGLKADRTVFDGLERANLNLGRLYAYQLELAESAAKRLPAGGEAE